MNCSTPGFPVHHQLHELNQIHVHRVRDVIQPSHSRSSHSPPALIFPRIRVFSKYIMRNAGLEETQAGIKIAGRNINHLRYADDTTLMAESEEKLKSLLMKLKESEEVGLKLNIQKTKIMASGPITSWEIDVETVETVSDFIFGGSKITADGDCGHEIKRRLLLGTKFGFFCEEMKRVKPPELPQRGY
ncbi:hypothetical protein AB1E18_015317 [Capra hircus]